MKKVEARFWKKLDNNYVQCFLCRRRCKIPPNGRGFCRVRVNENGKLYTLNYNNVIALAMDPIEKKPLFHFKPGRDILSYCLPGCNFRCLHCQNWEISQVAPDEIYSYEEITPEEMVNLALKYGSVGIAHTYTEPTVYFEYSYDVAKLAKEKGLVNVWVTNGYISEEALKEISKYLDAANIDLKAFNEKFYREVCGGVELEEVLESIKLFKKLGIWIELTYLIIPGLNDDLEEIRQAVIWIRDNLGKEVPLHFSRFFPHYKMLDRPPTPLETLLKAYEIAKEEGLYYVYIGNIWDSRFETTYCYNCGYKILERVGYNVGRINLTEDLRCPNCGAKQYFIL